MKFFSFLVSLSLTLASLTFNSANAATIYQTGAYGNSKAPDGIWCSSCTGTSPSIYIGEKFTLASNSSIDSIDFYMYSPVQGPTIGVTFYDAQFTELFSQTTASGIYTRTDLTNDVSNINVEFSTPLSLLAGDYYVFWSSAHLGIPGYAGFGNTQKYVMGSSNPIDIPGLSSAMRLNGSISAVPVPAAAWLFGSALIPLVGVGRRKLGKTA